MKLTKKQRELLSQIGSAGGKKTASQMTPEQRTERARKAVTARWSRKEKVTQ